MHEEYFLGRETLLFTPPPIPHPPYSFTLSNFTTNFAISAGPQWQEYGIILLLLLKIYWHQPLYPPPPHPPLQVPPFLISVFILFDLAPIQEDLIEKITEPNIFTNNLQYLSFSAVF